MWENTCATTQPAAQSLPPNSTSMDALVVGLAPKKGASKKEKKKKKLNRIGFEAKIPLDGSRRPVCSSRSRVAHFGCGGSQGVSESAGRLKVFLFFCRYEFDRSAWHLNRVQKCSTSQLRLHVDPRGPISRSVSVHLSKLKYLSRVFYFFGRRPKMGFQRLGPIRVRSRVV